MRIAPSILSADLADLAAALEMCEAGGADAIHFDVMDGHFVPNLTIGLPVLQAVVRRTRLPVDVHLMVTNPERLLDEWIAAGAAAVHVHWEVAPHLDRLLRRIRELGAEASVALNPATPVEVLIDVLPILDRVLLMSVNPGFSGQQFLPHVLDKSRRLAAMIRDAGSSTEIAVDGGIGPGNVRRAAEAGIGFAVAGSSVFGAGDPAAAIAELKRNARVELHS